MRISSSNKQVELSKKTFTKEQIEENTLLSNTNELSTVNYWLKNTLPFVRKLQNEEDKARAIFFEKELISNK